FASRRRHTSFSRDWSSDVCSSDLPEHLRERVLAAGAHRLAPGRGDVAGAAVAPGEARCDLLHLAEPVARLGVEALHRIVHAEPRSEERRVRKSSSPQYALKA